MTLYICEGSERLFRGFLYFSVFSPCYLYPMYLVFRGSVDLMPLFSLLFAWNAMACLEKEEASNPLNGTCFIWFRICFSDARILWCGGRARCMVAFKSKLKSQWVLNLMRCLMWEMAFWYASISKDAFKRTALESYYQDFLWNRRIKTYAHNSRVKVLWVSGYWVSI